MTHFIPDVEVDSKAAFIDTTVNSRALRSASKLCKVIIQTNSFSVVGLLVEPNCISCTICIWLVINEAKMGHIPGGGW